MLSWVTHVLIFTISRISTDFKDHFLKRKNVSLIGDVELPTKL